MMGKAQQGAVLSGLLAVALAGCAPVSPRIASAGHLPDGPGAGFAFAPGSAGDTALIGRCLATAGMSASAKPAYYVRLSRVSTTGASRVVGGDRAALSPEVSQPQPAPQPWPGSAHIEAMAISVTALATGDEVYHARLERLAARAGKPQPPLEQALCDAVIAPSPR